MPQVLLQSLQSSQSFISQCTGHSASLQFAALTSCLCSRSSHVPPCCSSLVTVRLLVFVPVPHVTLQEDHSPHWLTSQSTGGQSMSLQSSFPATASSHSIPPCSASLATVRERL